MIRPCSPGHQGARAPGHQGTGSRSAAPMAPMTPMAPMAPIRKPPNLHPEARRSVIVGKSPAKVADIRVVKSLVIVGKSPESR